MAAQPEFRPEAVLEVLVRHGVRFVVIGGLAALAHGSPFPTRDVDITPEVETVNLGRLSDALRELDARIWFSDDAEPVPFSHDAESLAASRVWNLLTRVGRIDVSLVPDGTRGYPDLAEEATEVDVMGVLVPTASLADVIRSKQAANRPKDQRVLPVLREILASRHQQ